MRFKPLVTIVFGTRPEAIKLAPVMRAFKECNLLNTRVIVSGQHREMVDQVLNLFNINPDSNLQLMSTRQTLTHITCSTLDGLQKEFQANKPEIVLVQGDTTTAFAAGLAAFYEKIKIGHVEAGLRTSSILDPFPEEVNRRLLSQLSTIHFAPTELSKTNLLNSGVLGEILITGNTVIDALHLIAKKKTKLDLPAINWTKNKVILVTVHRRENWGKRMERIANGLKKIVEIHPDIVLILPMHKNPVVRDTLKKILSNQEQIILTEPLPYDKLIETIKRSYLIITDSGGLQEEAPSLGKPVLVLRDTTERQEAVNAKTVKLIGTESKTIVKNVNNLITDKNSYNKMSNAKNPYGDGEARKRARAEPSARRENHLLLRLVRLDVRLPPRRRALLANPRAAAASGGRARPAGERREPDDLRAVTRRRRDAVPCL